MGEQMTFPKTFDEFAEHYKITDTKQVYTNGIEMIPIFRVKQWLSQPSDVVEVVRCKDCKEYRYGRCDRICYIMDGYYSDTFEMKRPEDFCSYGERK